MKKSILLFVIILLTNITITAQDYKVIHVKGDIEVESTHKNLVRGTAFSDKEKFQYKTNDARAVVINTKQGKRYILKGKTTAANYNKANLTPSAGNISSRAGGLNNRLDLKNHFDGKYVILGELRVVINSAAFPMSKDQFFFIRYVYKGETINKQLDYVGDTLIINKDSLLQVDGKPILNEDITEMELIYYTKKNDKISLSPISSTFYPVFPDEKTLKSELAIIVETMSDAKKEDIEYAINGYISEVYGKTNKENVNNWFYQNF